jgi:hypothetical protein
MSSGAIYNKNVRKEINDLKIRRTVEVKSRFQYAEIGRKL